MNSIPASQLVNVVPGVLGAGGNPLSMNSVFFTNDTSVPIGTVKSFPTLATVQTWFGPSSIEAKMAAVYFNGFTGATTLPGLLYFMQYNVANIGAYLRGGSLSGMSLAQLQALSGTIICTVDGVASTSLSINLASAVSFSNAAALIQTGIQGGTPSSTATVTYDAQRAGFVIHSPTTGASSTIGFATGTLAAGIKLQAAQGAVLSQGAVAATPAGAYATLTAITQNFAGSMLLWAADKDTNIAFATAVNALGQRYFFVGWDTTTPPTAGADPTSFAVVTATFNGRVAVWGLANGAVRPDGTIVADDGAIAKAAWVCGATASIDFAATNGRLDYAYKGQAGLLPDVTDAGVATNLLANGYNFYGAYATAADQFNNFQRGLISGEWDFLDPYVNQIKLNSDLQLAFIILFTQSKSVPYVTRGYDALRAAALGPITSAKNFGSIVAGVTLSQIQRQIVNTANNGANVADVLQSRGWFLQILDADPTQRAVRGSPPMTLWYMDGGSIQRINLASIAVQ